MKKKKKVLIRKMAVIFKVIVFTSFIYTAGIMFKYGKKEIGFSILFAIGLFLVLTKIDSIMKKLDEVDTRCKNVENAVQELQDTP